MKITKKSILIMLILVIALSMISSCTKTVTETPAATADEAKTFRFVMISKVVHPWFDQVHKGALAQAESLSKETGDNIIIDYQAPESADVVLQNQIIERTIATKPDGIFIDLLDPVGNRVLIQDALDNGIDVVIYDSESPEGMNLTKVGNDFYEQASIASDKVAELIGFKGKVAIMQGFPTAPNHKIRAQAHRDTFAKYPDIEVVAEGIDNDSMEVAQQQAAAIISANPDLVGFVSCDAAGPIGIGLAIKEAGKAGVIQNVGMDDLPQLIDLIAEGVVHSSSSTKPKMQGQYSVIALWQQAIGQPAPSVIDTGIGIVTQELAKGDYTGF